MIKILFFIDSLSGGGAEKVLRTLVNNMDQNKFQITVQTLNEVDAKQYLVPGIRYKAINRCKTAFGKKLFSFWIRLCAELKWLYPLYIKDDYDIEVAYLECGPTKIIAGSTNKNALKLAWVHCDLEQKEGIVAQAEKLKKHYKAYDKVICVSNNVRESYQRLFGNNPEAIVIHNVNDEDDIIKKSKTFVPERTSVVTIATVGRLSYEKSFDRLLEACRLLKSDGYDFQLWIIGDGQERQKLEKMIREFALEYNVKLLGFQANPYTYIAAADFVVVPSRYEGFSTVVTEALIIGKPVVTTPCSGMDELLGNSQYGLITENSIEGIYNGIKRMLDDPILLEYYENEARQRGKDFSKNTILSKTEQFFYDELRKKHSH